MNEIESLSKEDIQVLIETHNTNLPTIRNLLDGGVDPTVIDEVLEVRDRLSETHGDTSGRNRPVWEDTVSIKALLKAYHTASGDIELLVRLADKTIEKIARLDRINGRLKSGSFTAVLEDITNQYIKQGVTVLGE